MTTLNNMFKNLSIEDIKTLIEVTLVTEFNFQYRINVDYKPHYGEAVNITIEAWDNDKISEFQPLTLGHRSITTHYFDRDKALKYGYIRILLQIMGYGIGKMTQLKIASNESRNI